MNDASGAKPTIYLADYRASAWRVADLALELDLDPLETIVHARIVLERDAGEPIEDLVLDAESLEVCEVRIDGDCAARDRWQLGAERLTIRDLARNATVETRVRIVPESNTALQGLYASGSIGKRFLLTQCEAEGFRRITPFLDRPDVLTRYTVTLRADKARFPLLLANGNLDAAGELEGGRHWARFVDPHPKPSYLFALVAGELETIEDHYVTSDGRRVALFIHAEANAIGRCGWAMECVKLAMRWDEERFGRSYDLDVFHIVATHDFAMGAMENKGLNIFNAKYLLADPEHATDDDYRHVLAVVGHEYFHNWSGNRVTCRDWFQLSLKEGLTVYREQEFEADLVSRTLRRIEDVRTLWRAQFVEDAGPLAHPVRPDRYSEINNFYTATVYEKGAEIVRMLSVVLGRDGFRRGLDLYFDRHDGSAATVEDFLAALGEANRVDLGAWLAWYGQAGTPRLSARTHYDAHTRRFTLDLAQETQPTPGQPHKRAVPIPVAIALFGRDGTPLPLHTDDAARARHECVLMLDRDTRSFHFNDIAAPPVVSLLRGYSAPVRLDETIDAAALALKARHDSDGFNRWFAADQLARRLFAQALEHGRADPGELATYTACLDEAIRDDAIDPALLAEMLTLADANSLAAGLSDVDPEAVHRARSGIDRAVAVAIAAPALERHQVLSRGARDAVDLNAQLARRLRNALLGALCRAEPQYLELARAQLSNARNLTDMLAALGLLVAHRASDADALSLAFAQRYESDPLVIDKWFALNATVADPNTLERVVALSADTAFRFSNPNNVHALIGSFAMRNPRAFHRADGAGYRFIAQAILRVDRLTPQVSARIATAFGSWRTLEPGRRATMRTELEALAATAGNSPDLADILERTLAGPAH